MLLEPSNYIKYGQCIFQSFENIIPSKTSTKYSTEGILAMKNYLKLFTYKGLIAVIIILLILFFFSEHILKIIYGSENVRLSKYIIILFISYTN